MSGPLAKNIADEYDVDSRKSASILDIFGGCFKVYYHIARKSFQRLVPWYFTVNVIPIQHLSYIITGVCGLIAILFNFPKLKKNTSQEMKH